MEFNQSHHSQQHNPVPHQPQSHHSLDSNSAPEPTRKLNETRDVSLKLESLPSNLPQVEKLRAYQAEIEPLAKSYNLDFFPTIFEVVTADQLNAIAAYGGFPRRYPHYRFGAEYEQLKKTYDWGLAKIYELVINNNPCYAYLMNSNKDVDQKLVMAHVYGHCDFFKNNLYFAHTSRSMMDEMANHGARVENYIARYGREEVEKFIDLCLSVEDLIDIHAAGIKRTSSPADALVGADGQPLLETPGRFHNTKDYMDSWINPENALKEEREKLRKQRESGQEKFPKEPVHDVTQFILENAPLKDWQLDVLSIIRKEAYYFAPQGQTKIMNEGWASYWHSTMMTKNILTPQEFICFADHHSGTVATQQGRLNPYKLGIELFRDIEERWNKGRFGKEWEECEDMEKRATWDTKVGLGREKIFEVRRIHNDLTFIDTFLTPEFCKQHKLFSFAFNEEEKTYEIESREFQMVKQRLLQQLTNFGRPVIHVEDGNYKNRGELYLVHKHNGVDLEMGYARDTLENVSKLWSRPVHIETMLDGDRIRLSYDGNNFDKTVIEKGAQSQGKFPWSSPD